MGEESITWEAEIAEIASGLSGVGWDSPGVRVLEADLSEMTKGDEDPYFVDLIVLKEGQGTGQPTPKVYTSGSVEDTARLTLGALGFLGHQKPSDRDTEYRTPQMRIVKTRVDEVVENGRRIKVARAKGYVSRRSQDLRTHIREGMAGPVSLDGRAILERKGDEVLVTEMRHIRSIDFCNPGTEGVKGAGVLSVVSEMDKNEGRNPQVTTRLNKDQLIAEYGADIREMNREAVESVKKPLETEIQEMKTKVVEKDKRIGDLEKELAETKATLTKHESDVQEIAKERDVLRKRDAERTLLDHRNETVAKLQHDGAPISTEVREMVSKRVTVEVLEGDADLSKSKTEVEKRVAAAFSDVQEMAKVFGGSLKKSAEAPRAGGNPPRETKPSSDSRSALAQAVLVKGKDLYPVEK